MTAGSRVLLLVMVLTTVGCDRMTKHLAETNLAGMPGQSFLGDVVRLEYAENPGAFLSLGARLPGWARTLFLTFGAALGLAAVSIVAIKRRWLGMSLAGAMLMSSGGASNLVDRVARGSVVDFMSIGVGSLRTGIFNVADVAVMVGAALIVFGSGAASRRERA
jgi:signal peptidase II